MKLVMAIMSKDDASVVMDALTEESFQVTKMASTGGFLKSGNTTLIIGVEDDKIDNVIDIVTNTLHSYFDSFSRAPFEVTVGGAIIFVLNVDRFEKV